MEILWDIHNWLPPFGDFGFADGFSDFWNHGMDCRLRLYRVAGAGSSGPAPIWIVGLFGLFIGGFGLLAAARPHSFVKGDNDEVEFGGVRGGLFGMLFGVVWYLIRLAISCLPQKIQAVVIRLGGLVFLGIGGMMLFSITFGGSQASEMDDEELDAMMAQIESQANAAGVDDPTATAPTLPAAPTPPPPPPLGKADEFLTQASAAWQKGDYKGAVQAATFARNIRAAHLGQDHPKVVEVERMIEAATAKVNAAPKP